MKKILSILTVFVLSILIVGCGSNAKVPEVTPNEVQNKIDNHETFILIGSSTTCAFCEQYVPILDQFKQDEPDVDVVKVQIDQIESAQDRSVFVNRFVISGTPTTIFVKQGEVVATRAGVMSVAELKALTYNHLGIEIPGENQPEANQPQ